MRVFHRIYSQAWRFPSWMGILIVGLLVALPSGCGVQEYESLVQGRIQALKAEGQTAPIEWSEFRATSGTTIDWPGTADPKSSQQGDASAEELSLAAGGLDFRSVFMSAPTVEAARLAESTQQQFSGQGFALTDRREGALGTLTYVEVSMEHPQTADQVILRAYQLSPKQGCVLSVTGKRLSTNEDAKRFLDSVRTG